MLLKNLVCNGCLEVVDDSIIGRQLRSENDIKVDVLGCDTDNENQIWNLLSLEPSNTWFHFESEATGECLVTTGEGCDSDVLMGECDTSKSGAPSVWGYVGGEIISYDCFISGYQQTDPEAFLKTTCRAATFNPSATTNSQTFAPGNVTLDSQTTSDSADGAIEFGARYWLTIPVDLSGSVDVFDEAFEDTD